MISVETAPVKYTGADGKRWSHRAVVFGPEIHTNQDKSLRLLAAWCKLTCGEHNDRWRRSATVFYFKQPEHIMLFKLRWHGQNLP